LSMKIRPRSRTRSRTLFYAISCFALVMCASPGFCQPTSEAAQRASEAAQPASEAAQRAVQPSGQSSIPEVSLRDTDGNLVELRSLIRPGKPTIISFWASWCAPCKKELSNYAELYADWQKEFDVEVLAISIDDSRNSAKVKSYINGVKWPFRVLLDPNEDMKRALNFQTVPFSLLIDGGGRIAYRHNSYVEGDEYVMEEKLKKLKAIDQK
ncbi:MAG: TlpA family protein disulfide reductase, partial [Bacteroidota bacterium]